MLRFHLDTRARAGPERVLKAAQAEKAGLGAAGDAEQLQSQPPPVVAALHLFAVPSGLSDFGGVVLAYKHAGATATGQEVGAWVCVCEALGLREVGNWDM